MDNPKLDWMMTGVDFTHPSEAKPELPAAVADPHPAPAAPRRRPERWPGEREGSGQVLAKLV